MTGRSCFKMNKASLIFDFLAYFTYILAHFSLFWGDFKGKNDCVMNMSLIYGRVKEYSWKRHGKVMEGS